MENNRQYRLTLSGKDVVSALQAEHHLSIERPCGGCGRCGRCRIGLVSGTWCVDGVTVKAPGRALACRTQLVSDEGIISVPDYMVEHSAVLCDVPESTWDFGDEPAVGIDLGSTTVVASRILGGREICRISALNRQTAYGADVMSRIAYCGEDGHGVERLREELLSSLRCAVEALGPIDVRRLVIAGNTVMACLLHGINPWSIGKYPYAAPQLVFPEMDSASLGLQPGIQVWTVPCISGYIGGDIVSGLMCQPLQKGEALVDIGTNCEMVFNTGHGMIGTSASAGPAFEGGINGVTLRAVAGAIEHLGDDGTISVIGGGHALGFCGSGIIDYLAVMKRRGMLKANGQFADGRSLDRFAGIDIPAEGLGAIQLAKSAVMAGIKMMQTLGECTCHRVYLAGSFGEHLNLDNARAIGMLPACDIGVLGNTSLTGALRLAGMSDSMAEARQLVGSIQAFNLSEQPGYEQVFIEGLSL